MQRWEIPHPGLDFAALLEQATRELGLEANRMVSNSLPRKMHWHIKLPGSRGTLEATWLTESSEAWLSVHANRDADWILAKAEELANKVSNAGPSEIK
jgi:hypothetical protein